MKLDQILTEDVSIETSIRTIADILSTELPELYRKLAKMAERYYDSNGELGKGFNFVSGGQKTQWYHSIFVKHMRPSLYNLARHTGSDELKAYLSDSIGNSSFSSIEDILIGVLGKIAKNKNIKSLQAGVLAAQHARDAYIKRLDTIDVSAEEPDEILEPKGPNVIGQQNATVDALISDILSRIDRKNAGEIRQIIARRENKLQALQQELTRRGLNP